jgi:ribosome maturation protein Sdo1
VKNSQEDEELDMTSISPSIASLDDSLSQAYESLRKLQAAQSINVEDTIAQLKVAASSAKELRAMVSSELPNASWENRAELDALIEDNPEKFRQDTRRWFALFVQRARTLWRPALRYKSVPTP